MCPAPILSNSHSGINTLTALAAGGFSASGGGRAERLGNNGNLSNPAESTREKSKRKHTSRYRAQRVMRDVLGRDWGVSSCGCRVNIGAGVRSDGAGQTSMEGVRSCNSGHTCPVCGAKIAAGRAEEIRAAVSAAADLGLRPVLVTLTIQHSLRDTLPDLLADLMGAWSYAYTSAGAATKRFNERFGVAGFIRALELRYSTVAGWHPHYHLLMFVDSSEKLEDLQTDLHAQIFRRYAHWLTTDDGRIVAKRRNQRGYHANEHTVNVRVSRDGAVVEEYLTKLALEVSVGHDKDGRAQTSFSPFQLATTFDRDGGDWIPGVLRDYAAATKGRAAIRWSRGLRDLLELGDELTDEEIMECTDDLSDDEGDTPDVESLPMPYVFLDDGPAYASLWRRGLVGELRDIAGHVNGWDSNQVRQLYQWVATVTGMPDADIDDAVMRVRWVNDLLLAGGEMAFDGAAAVAAADREKWRSAWRSARSLYLASKDLVAQQVRPGLWPDRLRAAGFTVDEIEPFMRRYWSGLPLSPDVGDTRDFVLAPYQTCDENADSLRIPDEVNHG